MLGALSKREEGLIMELDEEKKVRNIQSNHRVSFVEKEIESQRASPRRCWSTIMGP